MIIGRENNLDIPIASYSNQLIYYLHHYLDMIDVNEDNFKGQADNKSKIILRWFAYPKAQEREEGCKAKGELEKKNVTVVKDYTRCFSVLLEKLAECVIIDRCINDINTNIMCMNIAKGKPNIYEAYEDIDYHEYIPFSPAHKHIYLYDEDGFLNKYDVPSLGLDCHAKEIVWCKKAHIMTRLQSGSAEAIALEAIKLQVKTSLNDKALGEEGHEATPVIYFDLMHDMCDLKEQMPYKQIYSAREIHSTLEEEIENYFKILIAYASDLITEISLRDLKIERNTELDYLFRAPIKGLLNSESMNLDSMIQLISERNKPVIVEL